MQSGKRTALIGDIGGTHARFAICDIDQLSVAHFAVFQTSMFPSLPDAVAHYLASVSVRPHIAGFSVADPATSERMRIENTSWAFTPDDIRGACGAERIHFVNNFAALAVTLPYLNSHDRHPLSGGQAVAGAPMVVLGIGGEFGAAALIEVSGKRAPIAGLAGHLSFSATNERELAVLAKIARGTGHVPMQSVLSGRGLEMIHATLSDLEGLPEPHVPGTEVIKLALEDQDALALDTLDCFIAILARVAGDLALLFDARGGVYIGRGIAPKILKLLDTDRFRELLLNKGALASHIGSIPVQAILANDAGLRGAAIATSEAFPM